jgi:hypothetical protein
MEAPRFHIYIEHFQAVAEGLEKQSGKYYAVISDVTLQKQVPGKLNVKFTL